MNRIYSTLFTAIALLMFAHNAAAGVIYDVNRAWTNGSQNASLVGTVDVDLGSYTIQNNGLAPFNAANLTLTVGGTSYSVNNVLTTSIFGSGLFSITATATELIFSALGNGFNPADLVFSDGGANRYAIGSDGNPAFEIAITNSGFVLNSSSPVFPVVWGTAVSTVPEPTTLALLGLGLVGACFARKKKHAD